MIDAGSGSAPAAELVMLQMTVDGQEDLTGTTLTLYGPGGEVTKTFMATGTLAHGEAMRAVLFATQAAAGPAPDFELGAGDFLDPAGGAACLTGPYPPDCVSWGSFPTAIAQALPDPHSFNAEAIVGEALGRSIGPGCSTWLGPDDDHGGASSADFYDGVPRPGPLPLPEPEPPPVANNAAAVVLTPCEVITAFNRTPANPSNDATPAFAYDQVLREYDTRFQCRLQGTPFSACDPQGITYPPLADGIYRFEAFAIGHAGSDPTPIEWEWEIDTVAPETAIDAVPPEPSSGFSAAFAFHSTEHHPSFRCQLDEGFKQACNPPKAYYDLADGPHVFRVWSSDQASNVDPSPALHAFSVDTRLGDQTPPNAKITSAPPNPSSEASSRFTYTSSEPGSSFQCRLDERPWVPCPATGISYGPRRNGRHLFAVRATDRAGNTDPVPDTHAWTIRAPLPQTLITRVPPGVSYLKAGQEKLSVSFGLRADAKGASFRCRVDKRRFRRCGPSLKLKAKVGRHRFEAYAVDRVGNPDPIPARWIFRIAHRSARSPF